MRAIDLAEVASSLEELIIALEEGREQEIVITRDGRPLAKLVPVATTVPGVRFGIAKGKFHIPDDFDAPDARIAKLFNEDGSIEPRP